MLCSSVVLWKLVFCEKHCTLQFHLKIFHECTGSFCCLFHNMKWWHRRYSTVVWIPWKEGHRRHGHSRKCPQNPGSLQKHQKRMSITWYTDATIWHSFRWKIPDLMSFPCNHFQLLHSCNVYEICRSSVVLVFLLLTNSLCVFPLAALSEPQICYVLDGILFLYGIILTALYCRIKVCMLRSCLYRNTRGAQQNFFTRVICITKGGNMQ